jgi:hypothetical protein
MGFFGLIRAAFVREANAAAPGAQSREPFILWYRFC